MEGIEHEGGQTEQIEMDRARGRPAAQEDEQPDEQIEQPDDSQIVLNRRGLVGGDGDQRGLEFPPFTRQAVARLRPYPQAPQSLGDLCGAAHRSTVQGDQRVSWPDPRTCAPRVRSHEPGTYTG